MNETNCGCCEGIEKVTPLSVANRPGLAALRYRVGTHAHFFQTMLAALSGGSGVTGVGTGAKENPPSAGSNEDPLRHIPATRNLTTRETGDPAIALLDAGAVLLDVLTFYQERLANEGYLRTAIERRSVLELARLIGYRLRPGVASSVYLAFTLENGYEVEIPAGTRAQSIPRPGELPQSFETAEPLLARTEWNTFKPRLTQPTYMTPLTPGLERLYFQGTATNLAPNTPLLFVFGDGVDERVLRFVESVELNPAGNSTAVTLQMNSTVVTLQISPDLVGAVRETVNRFLNLEAFGVSEGSRMAGRVTALLKELEARLSANMLAVELAALFDEILPALRDEHAIAAEGGFIRLEPWVGELLRSLEAFDAELRQGEGGASILAAPRAVSGNGNGALVGLEGLVTPLLKPPSLQPRNSVRLRRDYKSLFSARADTLPRLLTTFQPRLKGPLYPAWANTQVAPVSPLQSANALRLKAAPYGHNAPRRNVRRNPPHDITPGEWPLVEEANILALDAQYDQIKPGSWVVIERPREWKRGAPYDFETIYRQVDKVRTVSRNEYGFSARVTQLTLDGEWCQSAIDNNKANTSFLRSITVYTQSELLTLAEEPVTTDIEGATLELDALYDGLETGRWIIVSGERSDIPGTSGVMASELVMLSGVTQGVSQMSLGTESFIDRPGDKIHTTLQLANALAYKYKRDTVVIYGNVVNATHGETRQEVLGSGNASQAFQTFFLKQAPLTFISAPTPSGIASTLEVRVNDLRWPEVEGLVWLEADQRGYVTKTDDEEKTSVVFGDGEHGARLPTGQENVRAVYRFGIGKPGNVSAGQISLLTTKPLGVKSVTNPLPATGGADREDRDQARENAPLAVMALDRLVSVQDYADFARTFAGVGKASAVALSDGRREPVHVTIAGADDIPIDETSDLFQNLLLAFRQFNGDPFQPVMLAVRTLKLLVIVARVRLLADYAWESVEPAIRASLLEAFGFARRGLGEALYSSQVIGAIQAIPGVAYVDLEVLDIVDENSDVSDLENLAQTLDLRHHIPVHLARLDPNLNDLPRRILAAELAYLSPEIPDTLILTELTQ